MSRGRTSLHCLMQWLRVWIAMHAATPMPAAVSQIKLLEINQISACIEW